MQKSTYKKVIYSILVGLLLFCITYLSACFYFYRQIESFISSQQNTLLRDNNIITSYHNKQCSWWKIWDISCVLNGVDLNIDNGGSKISIVVDKVKIKHNVVDHVITLQVISPIECSIPVADSAIEYKASIKFDTDFIMNMGYNKATKWAKNSALESYFNDDSISWLRINPIDITVNLGDDPLCIIKQFSAFFKNIDHNANDSGLASRVYLDDICMNYNNSTILLLRDEFVASTRKMDEAKDFGITVRSNDDNFEVLYNNVNINEYISSIYENLGHPKGSYKKVKQDCVTSCNDELLTTQDSDIEIKLDHSSKMQNADIVADIRNKVRENSSVKIGYDQSDQYSGMNFHLDTIMFEVKSDHCSLNKNNDQSELDMDLCKAAKDYRGHLSKDDSDNSGNDTNEIDDLTYMKSSNRLKIGLLDISNRLEFFGTDDLASLVFFNTEFTVRNIDAVLAHLFVAYNVSSIITQNSKLEISDLQKIKKLIAELFGNEDDITIAIRVDTKGIIYIGDGRTMLSIEDSEPIFQQLADIIV